MTVPADQPGWQLHHSKLCPFSRTVRLSLSERGLAYELIEAVPADRIAAMRLGRDSRIPALYDTSRSLRLIGSYSICEFLEEAALGKSLMLGSAEQRAETRRLVAWAGDCVYEQVISQALRKQLPGREIRQPTVDKEPVTTTAKVESFLDEIDMLLDRRRWLAGPTLGLADLAMAAHVSVADYLGVINWSGHQQAQTWYSVIKSRRSFQPLLADRVDGITPTEHYSKIDT